MFQAVATSNALIRMNPVSPHEVIFASLKIGFKCPMIGSIAALVLNFCALSAFDKQCLFSWSAWDGDFSPFISDFPLPPLS